METSTVQSVYCTGLYIKESDVGDIAEIIRGAIKLQEQGDLAAAEKIYRDILAHDPKNHTALHLLGIIAMNTRHLPQAIALLSNALALNPNSVNYYFYLARAHELSGAWPEATRLYQIILKNKPNDIETNINLGILLGRSGYIDQAIKHLRRVIKLKPRNIMAKNNLALLLLTQGDYSSAETELRKILKQKPDYLPARDNLLFLLSYHVRCSPDVMLSAHMKWDKVHGEAGRRGRYKHALERPVVKRLRIGYVSGDFKNHPVSYFFEPILAAHDRERVEVICYAEVSQGDKVTQRLQALADGWVTTVGMNDEDMARRIHNDGIDILVDLAGHTANNRLGAFTYKPAPIQASYLGYFTTTGLEAMDYWLSDSVLTPKDTVEQTTETIYRLPRCCVIYQPPVDAPPVSERKPGSTLTFGSFNDLSKISPAAVERWCHILKLVPESHLLLKAKQLSDEAECKKWRAQFETQGIDADRILLRSRTESQHAHLEMYGEIDIALDSMPRTGGTTTTEALFMGVPVVSLKGERFIERLSSSMLNTLGLDELATDCAEKYIEIAVALANDEGRRQQLRSELRERMLSSALCDARGLASALEQAYQKMWH
jgi:predicted O-linked N-acetylglucosamine transferase (SPINDLY family)